MDFERWHRKEERKAMVMLWKGGAVMLFALVASGVLKGLAAGAPALVQPVLSVFLWGPLLFVAGAIVMFAVSGWRLWRLHIDPFSMYEDR